MKVFISWSGEMSKMFAAALKEWLEQCIQSLEVFFSSEDIEKGEDWQAKLSSELKDTNYGIVCLTTENVNAPWIHFEAGALSKMLNSRVMVVALNINYSDIVGPLKTFQATKFEEDDVLRLLQSINNSQDKPLDETKLKRSFNAFWPQFNEKIVSIIQNAPQREMNKKTAASENVSEIIDEILQLVRNQNSIINDPEKLLPVKYLSYAFSKTNTIMEKEEQMLDEIYHFTNYIISKEVLPLKDANTQRFYENYNQLIMGLCSDNPVWKKRFSAIFMRLHRMMHLEDQIEIPLP